jgi:phosphomevalonate kinase
MKFYGRKSEMILLLISGWSGSGKDEVAKRLESKHSFLRFAFADAVKKEYCEKNDVSWDDMFHREKKELHRMNLIQMAEKRRNDDPGYWARKVATNIQTAFQKGFTHFVISDWRNIPEILTLQIFFPLALIVPIRVHRPCQILSPIPNHATEYGLLGFPFSYILTNDGNLEDLDQKCLDLLETVKRILPSS